MIERVAQIGGELGREHIIIWRCLARRNPLEDWLSFGGCPNLDCPVSRGDTNARRVLADERIEPAEMTICSKSLLRTASPARVSVSSKRS